MGMQSHAQANMSCVAQGMARGDLPYSPMIRRSPALKEPMVKIGRAAPARGLPGLLLAGAAALVLSACASGARTPDLTLPQAFQAPAGAQDLSVRQLDHWWLIFGD